MKSLQLEKQKNVATDLLVSGKYEEAVELLLVMREQDPEDIDILLELAHGYWQLSSFEEAKKIYHKIVRLDPTNTIANKKLANISTMLEKAKSPQKKQTGKRAALNELIEEPGCAKSVRLSTIGKHEELGQLSVGEEVSLNIRKRKIEVRDMHKHFVGYVPDDISKRLIELMQGGTTYEAYIHSVDRNECRVFIRETKKPAKYANTPSFPLDTSSLMPSDDEPDEDRKRPTEEETGLDLDAEETIIPTKDPSDEEESEEEDDADDDDPVYREYEE